MKCKEQKLVDIMFSVVMMIHDPKYRDNFMKMDREEIAEYVAKQLRDCGFDTKPCGMSWGVLRDKPTEGN